MMKIKIFTAFIGIFGFVFLEGQNLEFKDKNLEKAIIENYDQNKDGTISQLEAEAINNLFLVEKGITSTEDLHFFKNVKMIVLDDNVISSIVLQDMDKLNLFSCTGCKVTSFKAENLRNLTSLYLDNNSLDNISLKTTPKIDQLTLSLNQLKTIDISQLKNLRRLNVEHNKIRKIDISGNPALQTLNVGGNKMDDSDIKKAVKANVTIFGINDPN